MNVTELARKLKLPTKELLEILPEVGIDIGKRAIKIDDRTANRIIKDWRRLHAQYKDQQAAAQPEKQEIEKAPEAPKIVALPESLTVKEFAEKIGIQLPKVMGELMKNGVLASMNEKIDFDTAAIVGAELGIEITAEDGEDEKEEQTAKKLEDALSIKEGQQATSRPPVVVVMGHVDHGKTKLLDSIREANVVDKESGGITQHIGAYQAEHKDQLITFIDTPGHEAFTTMRSRGARVADIAILVIAADDSIQPQTKESIKIIKSAGLPMVVAINKIDKPEANIEKVKQDLAANNLIPEDWGGKTITVPISAKNKTNLDDLLEMILLVAETEKDNIVADPALSAVGTIVEAHVDKGEGPVATALVQNGTLRRGDKVTIADSFYGKIRAMKNFKGEDIAEAGPSVPVKIIGLKAAPSVGDMLQSTDKVARREKISKYQLKEQATAYTKPVETSSDEGSGRQTLNVVLRSDVLGSLEAIISSLTQIEHPEVSINIIAKGLGNITESDVERAISGNAIIYGFHVKPSQQAERLAQDNKIPVRRYEVIYHLLENAKEELQKLLKPEVIKTDIGRLKVLAIFKKEKGSMILGGQVTKGVARNNVNVNVLQGTQVIGTGKVVVLQQNKVETDEVAVNNECGLKFEGKIAVQEGDILEFYTEEIKEKKL